MSKAALTENLRPQYWIESELVSSNFTNEPVQSAFKQPHNADERIT
jgi:hypothetical protein